MQGMGSIYRETEVQDSKEWKRGLMAKERRKCDKTDKRMKPPRTSHGISA